MLRRDPGPSTVGRKVAATNRATQVPPTGMRICVRSEEHTSELQSHLNLVCRLLLEKKKKKIKDRIYRKSYTVFILQKNIMSCTCDTHVKTRETPNTYTRIPTQYITTSQRRRLLNRR